jgi:hypothetical protein
MRHSYQQPPYFGWYSSIPNFNSNRSEPSNSLDRIGDGSVNCLKLGDLAPDFSLEGVLGEERVRINLSDQKGKWTVLFFYSSNFSFV